MHVDFPDKVTQTSLVGADEAVSNIENSHEGAANEPGMPPGSPGHDQTLEPQALDNSTDQPPAASGDVSADRTPKRNRSKSSAVKTRPVCLLCNKTFHTNYKLNEHHAVVHLDKRLFSCNVCQKTFGRADHLVRHVKNRVCVMRQQHDQVAASIKTGDTINESGICKVAYVIQTTARSTRGRLGEVRGVIRKGLGKQVSFKSLMEGG